MAGVYLKRLDPGAFNKRVTFCRQTDTEDDIGKITNGLEDVITLWADFYPTRGRETSELNKLQGVVTYRCFLRCHSALSGIDSTWFIKYRGKVFYIESVIDIGLKGRYLEIYCTEYIGKEEMPGIERQSEDELATDEGEETWP